MPTVTTKKAPPSDKKEIEWLLAHEAKPQDTGIIYSGITQGIVHDKARHPKIRHLHNVFATINTATQHAFFNYKTMEWEVRYGAFQNSNYSANIAQAFPEWRKKIRVINNKGQSVNQLYGVEVEMYENSAKGTPNGGLRAELMEFFGRDYIYIKSDGSLSTSSLGLEVNTVPDTIENLVSKWGEFFDAGLADKFFADQTCGIHTHLSIKGTQYWYKHMWFIHCDENVPFVKKISRRATFNYATIGRADGGAPRDMPGNIIEFRKKFGKQYINSFIRGNSGRGVSAICFNEGKGTVELRLFQTTLDKTEFLMSLEFADAMYHFCLNTSMLNMSYKDFIIYVLDHKRTRLTNRARKPDVPTINPLYPNLSKVLLSRFATEVAPLFTHKYEAKPAKTKKAA